MVRRTTTALVPMHIASSADVIGLACSAMCSSAWSVADSLLSRLM
jgi:hypothetical protein